MIKEEKLEELKRKRLIYQGLLAQVDRLTKKLKNWSMNCVINAM